MDPIGQDKTLQFLSTAMAVANKRHNLIASNIANVDTPGYRAKDFDFEQVMRDTLDRMDSTEARFVGSVGAKVLNYGMPIEERNDIVWQQLDRNNVNLESEMGNLSEVSEKFKLAAKLFQFKYKLVADQIRS